MWKKLDINDLRTILSEDEIQRLQTLSLEDDFEDVLNRGMDIVSDMWRGALAAKGYTIDVRDHYTPPEYAYWILIHARFALWTRFPQTPDFALDKAREAEYKKALEILHNPFINVSAPDYSEDPSLSAQSQTIGADSITVPPMRFMPWYTYGG